jgi:hypothetical protein
MMFESDLNNSWSLVKYKRILENICFTDRNWVNWTANQSNQKYPTDLSGIIFKK